MNINHSKNPLERHCLQRLSTAGSHANDLSRFAEERTSAGVCPGSGSVSITLAYCPLEETLDAYAQLIKQGKVRAIGASNYSAERLGEALQVSRQHGLPRYECLQPFYNLYDRAGFEAELEPLCRKENIGVISYFSLAKGFLTGKYRSEKDLSKSARGGGVKAYLNDRGFRILAGLDQVAKENDSTSGRVALAWLMTRPSITAPISSATSLEQLNDLVEATKLELDRASIELLDRASDWKEEKAA